MSSLNLSPTKHVQLQIRGNTWCDRGAIVQWKKEVEYRWIEVESGSGLTFSNEIAFQKFSSLTGANCSDPGTGTKREQRGGAESDI